MRFIIIPFNTIILKKDIRGNEYMEKNRRIIEIILALAFVGILFAISMIVITSCERNIEQEGFHSIINSYNSYTTYKTEYIIVNPIQKVQPLYSNERENYAFERDRYSLPCDSYSGQERGKEFLGNYVKEYYVYVRNKEEKGMYFTVRFKLKNEMDYEYIESVTYYLRADEKKKFSYYEIASEGRRIVHWEYEVIPEKN
jgi:hypothetical protein